MSWKTLSTQSLLKRPPFVDVQQEQVEVRPGQVIDDFYKVHLMDFALVIPFLADGRVEMIRQYKHGPAREVLGFPAGHVDPGEDPATAAQRELLEETGLKAENLIHLGSFVDHGNQRVCQGHYFVAPSCERVTDPDPGDLEDFAYEALSPAQIDRAIMKLEVGVMHHVAAWGLWKIHSQAETETDFSK